MQRPGESPHAGVRSPACGRTARCAGAGPGESPARCRPPPRRPVARVQRGRVRHLGHQQHPITILVGDPELVEQRRDLGEVGGDRIGRRAPNHELELPLEPGHQAGEHAQVQPITLVPWREGGRALPRRAVTQLRRDRHQVGLEPGLGDRARGLDRQEVPGRAQLLAELRRGFEEQRLAAGQDHVARTRGAPLDQLGQLERLALGCPRAARGVAPGAAEVAAADPHEAARCADAGALALQRHEALLNPQPGHDA